jgi:four helix bundle protein
MLNHEWEKIREYDLDERLIDFAVAVIKLNNYLPNNRTGIVLGNQLVKSGTSPALNYGEALSAESRRDFIHKLKIVLKELRETLICLKIIDRTTLLQSNEILNGTIKENNELIAIFVKSVETANKNRMTKKG